MTPRTELLFARPSFLRGVARILDPAGMMDQYNTSATPEQADARAIRSDWYAVGDDLRAALNKLRDEVAEQSHG